MRGAAAMFSMRSPRADAGGRGQRHQQRAVLAEADHFGDRSLSAEAVDPAQAAQRQREVGRFDRQAGDRLHLPDDAERHRAFDGVELGGRGMLHERGF